MRGWVILIAATLYVGASLLGAAKAAPPANCQSEAKAKQWVLTLAKDATFSTLDAKAYLAAFDQISPVSKTTVPDQLIAATSPSHQSVLLLSFGGGVFGSTGLYRQGRSYQNSARFGWHLK
jgi:membrane-bound lytic murein transglycosylase B